MRVGEDRRSRLSLTHFGLGRDMARTVFGLCLPPGLLRPESVSRVEQLHPDGWRHLRGMADALGVTPLMHHCLGTADLLGLVPDDQRQELADACEAQRQHNQEVVSGLGSVFEQAAKRGCRVAAIKETALSGVVYPHVGLRYQRDVDLLVDETCLQEMRSLAEDELGYKRCDFKAQMVANGQYWPLPLPHGAEMLDRAVPGDIAGSPGQRVAPQDNLIWMCWHDFNHGWGVLPRLLDIIWSIDASQSPLPWDQVLELAQRWGTTPAMYPALSVAHRAAGAPVPEFVIDKLREAWGPEWLRGMMDLDLWLWPLEARQTHYWWHVARWHAMRDSVRAQRAALADTRVPPDGAKPSLRVRRALRYAVGYSQARYRWLWQRMAQQGRSAGEQDRDDRVRQLERIDVRGTSNQPEDLSKRAILLRDLLAQAQADVQGARVLDVGCGQGAVSLVAVALGARQVCGMDNREQSLASFVGYARQLPSSLAEGCETSAQLADAAALPYASGSFDLVLMIEVCSHILRLQEALAEAVRVLRTGGCLAISDGNNALNPLTARRARAMWAEREERRSRNRYQSYVELRREYIRRQWPSLDPDDVENLARTTAGLTYAEIDEAASRYRGDGKVPLLQSTEETPAVNPAGWYDENLLDPRELASELSAAGLSSVRIVPYWGRGTAVRRLGDSALRSLPLPLVIPLARGFRLIGIK